MSANEFSALLKKARLTPAQAAVVLGRTERAIRNWISGARRIPGPETILLRLLAAGVISVKDIESVKRRR